jgi:hypothetical protein
MRSTCSHEELQNIIKQDVKEHPIINNNTVIIIIIKRRRRKYGNVRTIKNIYINN